MATDTIVVLPDPQALSYIAAASEILNSQPQWCLDNKERLGIGLVLCVGDLVNDGSSTASWARAYTAYNRLRGQIPTVFAQGNHDVSVVNDRIFPASLAAQPMNALGSSAGYGLGDFTSLLGGTMQPNDWSNSWTLVTLASGRVVLVLSLEFCTRTATMAWAEDVLQANPGVPTIILTHAFMLPNGTVYDGNQVFDPIAYNWTPVDGITKSTDIEAALVVPYPQVKLVFCGHEPNCAHYRKTITRAGGTKCHYMVQDYQEISRYNEGYQYVSGYHGYMLVLRLLWDQDVISGRVYSPYLNRYYQNDGLDPNYTASAMSGNSNNVLIRNAGIK